MTTQSLNLMGRLSRGMICMAVACAAFWKSFNTLDLNDSYYESNILLFLFCLVLFLTGLALMLPQDSSEFGDES